MIWKMNIGLKECAAWMLRLFVSEYEMGITLLRGISALIVVDGINVSPSTTNSISQANQ